VREFVRDPGEPIVVLFVAWRGGLMIGVVGWTDESAITVLRELKLG
jgi:hypothetical protein